MRIKHTPQTKGMRHNDKCENCGAPLNFQQECQYCGSIFRLPVKKTESKYKNRDRYYFLIALLLVLITIIYVSFLYFSREDKKLLGSHINSHTNIERNFANKSTTRDVKEIRSLSRAVQLYQRTHNGQIPSGFDAMIAISTDEDFTNHSHYFQNGLVAMNRIDMGYLNREHLQWLAKWGLTSINYAIESHKIRPQYKNLKMQLEFDSQNEFVITTSQYTDEVQPERQLFTDKRIPVMFWNERPEVLTGQNSRPSDGSSEEPAYLILGLGNSTSIFTSGLMKNPRYQSSKQSGYTNYLSVWAIGKFRGGHVVPDKNLHKPKFITILNCYGETLEEITSYKKDPLLYRHII